MRKFTVTVRKLTDEELMREACSVTFLGKSKQSLKSIYSSEHSPARTQVFWIKLENIPLFVSTHFIRHHVGSQPFQLTCRKDRTGGNPGLPERILEIKKLMADFFASGDQSKSDAADFQKTMDDKLTWISENCDRETPVDLGVFVNAQSLIDMAKLRLCMQASVETRTVFKAIKEQLKECDPDLAAHLVPKCVYRAGICCEPRTCGYITQSVFVNEFMEYAKACGLTYFPPFAPRSL